jgi:hypothetical protein
MIHASTKGGKLAHIVRRMLHLSMIFIPVVYYFFLIPHFSHEVLRNSMLVFLCAVLLFEIIRIRLGFVFFAQRLHEATHFSAFGWTMISIAFVLLFSPAMPYTFAIIGSCALADPIVGELRQWRIEKKKIIMVGLLVVLGVWATIAYLCGISYYWGLLMAPITIAAEWPSLEWIDDNALMLLVPLVLSVVGH